MISRVVWARTAQDSKPEISYLSAEQLRYLQIGWIHVQAPPLAVAFQPLTVVKGFPNFPPRYFHSP